MKYIKDGPFIAVTGKAFKLQESLEDPGHDAGIGEMLKVVLITYDTNHAYFVAKGLVLKPSEVNIFNKLMGILEQKRPNEDTYWAIEDSDWDLLKRIAEWVNPIAPWWRNGPIIMSIIEGAVSMLPRPSENGVVPDLDMERLKV